MRIHTALESWQIIPIWKTVGWKTVPLISRANKEPRWPGNSPALRNLDTERVQRIDTTGGARSNKCWKHRCMEAIGTSAKVISVEQTQGSNIPSVRQRFKSAVQSWANKLLHSMLDPIQEREMSLRCTWPQVTTILHDWSDHGFVEVKTRFWS